ncbi:nuclear transport factor 2 family protein [Paenarthrobacter sp.]|uniref:nuclear transport factor 2 family protein n=1 Tax=Paenarthrobacter sp. TaxID=1931993 RepID=UPI0028115020|nr:nuclear transport factor 2 family protein [Paenarthrobacter sp.]
MMEQELLATAKDWARAIVENDAALIATFVTDDWVIVSDSGVSPGKKFLDLVASGDLTHSSMDMVGEARIRIFGDSAALTSRITSTAHYRGLRSDADEWTTDIFIKRGDRWLCALTHYTAVNPHELGVR